MPKLYYGGKGDLDWCADTVEEIIASLGVKRFPAGPVVGVNVQVSHTVPVMTLTKCRYPSAEKAGL